VKAGHTYAAAGQYLVMLTVTDNRGASTSSSVTVTVAAQYAAPTAVISVDQISGRRVWLDGQRSSRSTGTIISYSWDFGDGRTATGGWLSHLYATAGRYWVTLTVTDNQGGLR